MRQLYAKTFLFDGFPRSDNVTIQAIGIKGCKRTSAKAFIDVKSAKNVVIEDVVCTDNENKDGSTCVSAVDSSVSVINMMAEGNSVNQRGGAMKFSSSIVKITNGTFRLNSAEEEGGAMYLNLCDLVISGADFALNEAGSSGGAVAAEVGHSMHFILAVHCNLLSHYVKVSKTLPDCHCVLSSSLASSNSYESTRILFVIPHVCNNPCMYTYL